MISENGNIPFKKSILYSNVILSFVVITSSAVEITGVIKLYRREWGGLHHVSIANLTTTEISKWNTKRTPGWNGVGSEFAVTLSLNQTISSKLLSGEVIGEWSSYLQGLLPYTSLVLSRLQKKKISYGQCSPWYSRMLWRSTNEPRDPGAWRRRPMPFLQGIEIPTIVWELSTLRKRKPKSKINEKYHFRIFPKSDQCHHV